jgi:hypothetical protein
VARTQGQAAMTGQPFSQTACSRDTGNSEILTYHRIISIQVTKSVVYVNFGAFVGSFTLWNEISSTSSNGREKSGIAHGRQQIHSQCTFDRHVSLLNSKADMQATP